jgi:hypothetical protein
MKNYGYYVLAGLSIAADLLGVLSFLGVSATPRIKLLVGVFLLLLATLSAGGGLVTSLHLWLSPKGSHYSWSTHAARIGSSCLAALLVVVFGIFVVNQVKSHRGTDLPGGPPAINENSPRSPSSPR